MILRKCSANQSLRLEDRPFMSEIMGVAGWEQTPAMMKMTINCHYIIWC